MALGRLLVLGASPIAAFVRSLYGVQVAEKIIYERKAVRFKDARDVQPAITYSNSGQIKGKIAEWRDTKTVGLTLRITPGKVVWYIRRREITLRIGLANEIDLDTARYVTEQAQSREIVAEGDSENIVHTAPSNELKNFNSRSSPSRGSLSYVQPNGGDSKTQHPHLNVRFAP